MATSIPGPISELPPNENAGPKILGATLSVTIIALISTIGRLWFRSKIKRRLGWDDYAMLVATIAVVVGEAMIITQTRYGVGRHINHVPDEDKTIAVEFNFISQLFYVFAITCAKFSIGLFLLRILVSRFIRWTIIGVIVFMWLYTLLVILARLLQCTNPVAIWNNHVHAKCLSPEIMRAFSYTNSALCMATDLFFALIIPMMVVRTATLNFRDKTKILIISSMSLGILASAASIVKLCYIYSFGVKSDWMWDSQYLTIWTVVECCVGIIAGNLPPLRKYFSHVMNSQHDAESQGGNRTDTSPRPPSSIHSHGSKGAEHRRSLKNGGFITGVTSRNDSHDLENRTAVHPEDIEDTITHDNSGAQRPKQGKQENQEKEAVAADHADSSDESEVTLITFEAALRMSRVSTKTSGKAAGLQDRRG